MSAALPAWLGAHGLSAQDILALFGHFLVLSMLAVGGAITTAPDMQRWLVREQGWITDEVFTASVGVAQAAPGPNLLFVAVVGWNVAGPLGVLATTVGILIPSSTLALGASRWLATHRGHPGVRIFTAGLAPLTIGLMCATAWVLGAPARHEPAAWALVALTVAVMQFTRLSPLWLIGLGALAGGLGWL